MPIKYNVEKRISFMKQQDILPSNKKYIEDFIEYNAAEGNSKSRQAKYCSILAKIGVHIKYDFIKADKSQIQELKKWINNSSKSNWTKHDYLLTIKVFYKYLYETYYPRKDHPELYLRGYPEIVEDINPKKARGKKKLPRQLITFDDVQLLAENTHNPRDRALIITLFETGARISELLQLKISDVDTDKYGARITLPDATKTGARKIRVIWSAPAIVHWLRHHPKNKPNSYLFCGLQKHNLGKELQYRHVNDLLKEAAEKTGIAKPVNPHHFRHSRASELAKKLTEAQLCEYMGWVIGSREARTYVHLSGRDSDKAILEMHGILPDERFCSKCKKQINEKYDTATHEGLCPHCGEQSTFILESQLNKHTTIECPRCHIINDPFAKFCNGCGLSLDEKSIMEYDKQKEEAAETGLNVKAQLMNDPEFMKSMIDMLSKEMEKKKKNH